MTRDETGRVSVNVDRPLGPPRNDDGGSGGFTAATVHTSYSNVPLSMTVATEK